MGVIARIWLRYSHCSHAHLAAMTLGHIDAGLFLQFPKSDPVNPDGNF